MKFYIFHDSKMVLSRKIKVKIIFLFYFLFLTTVRWPGRHADDDITLL